MQRNRSLVVDCRSGFILLALLAFFFGCRAEESSYQGKQDSKEQQTQAQEVQPKEESKDAKTDFQDEEIKVTFVELGSVKCIPCKMMQPIIEEIQEEYKGQVKVVFHDVWTPEGRPYAEKYRIRAIPTQVFLDKDGNEYYRHQGYFPKDELVEVLKRQGVR